MKAMRTVFWALILWVAVSAMPTVADTSHLTLNNVKQIMQQILSEHVDQHDLTSAIMQRSVQIYLDQADPDHLYLLQKEVDPLLNLSEGQMAQLLTQYQKNDYSFFTKIDGQIQSAMNRARGLRQIHVKELPNIFADAKKRHESGQDKTAPTWDQYAASTDELNQRQREKFIDYINTEMYRFGMDPVMAKQSLILKRYEGNLHFSEGKYLNVDGNGKTLTAEDQEHLLALRMLKALSKSLDSHTAVFNDSEAEDMRMRLEKGFKGIGIEFSEDLDGFYIKEMMKGAPAEKSGKIQAKDQLIAVNGQTVSEMTLQGMMMAVRGDGKADAVTLTLKRGEGKPFDVTLKREEIIMQDSRVKTSFETYKDGIIGTISLDTFYEGENGVSAVQDVGRAIRDLEAKGKLLGLVLDLRNNPGGYLTQAVKVAGLFISDGVVVVSKYSNGDKQYYRDLDSNNYYNGPLVVLTSRLTASAAEIVAQALQDYGVAVVVGDDRTYGKGTIQAQTVTDSGASSYFKVTVGEYYTPSGRSPQIEGIKSDVLLPGPYSQTKVGERYLDNPIAADKIDPSFNDPLHDIDAKSKPWFLKYYVPNLQGKVATWQQMIPQLIRNSATRQKASAEYQTALKELLGDQGLQAKGFDMEDYRLREAMNIVKDMAVLQSFSAQATAGPRQGELSKSPAE